MQFYTLINAKLPLTLHKFHIKQATITNQKSPLNITLHKKAPKSKQALKCHNNALFNCVSVHVIMRNLG